MFVKISARNPKGLFLGDLAYPEVTLKTGSVEQKRIILVLIVVVDYYYVINSTTFGEDTVFTAVCLLSVNFHKIRRLRRLRTGKELVKFWK